MANRNLAAIIAAVLTWPLGSCCSRAPAPTPTPGALRIGTWNLEHFGQRDKFQDRKDAPKNRTPAQVKAVAAFINDMNVDVLALQEIGGPEPMRKLLAHLPANYRFCLGTTGIYGKTRISVGFLWRSSRVQLVQCEEMASFPRKLGDLSVFHRKPVNAVFRARNGGLDFRAIVVHLKASRGKKNEAMRTAEVGVLREYLAKLQAAENEDQDVLVLGDFNHTYGAPAYKAFTEDDLVFYPMNPINSLDRIPSPTIIWFDDPIDHIALTKGVRQELVPGSYRRHTQGGKHTPDAKGKITQAELEWRQTYSDHFPVTIDLDTSRDRDAGHTFAKPTKTLPVMGAR